MINNLFKNIPGNKGIEIFQELVNNENVKIERIISFGPESNDGKWYNQDLNEWVILLKGSAKIIFEDESVILQAGDYLLINSHQKHKVEILEKITETIWLAVFFQ